MYAKQLSEQKQNLIAPVLLKLQDNQELQISNPNPEVLEEIRLTLYTWQAINKKPGYFKIIRQGNPLKSIKVINRQILLASPSILAVPESKLSKTEELVLSIAELTNESEVLEKLHAQNLLPEQIYTLVQEWRKQTGKEVNQ